MKTVFFGTPEFALPTLDRLLDSGHEVVLVVTRPDKPTGRHQELTAPPVAVAARQRGLEVVQPKTLKKQWFVDQLAATGAEAGVVVAFGRLLPEPILSLFRYGLVNLHPSLLPRHRGPSPIQWSLACGDRTTGVTTMRLDEGMDTGPLLLQERVAIDQRETAEELGDRLAILGAELVVRTLDGLSAGTVRAKPQPADGANVTPMLKREFGEVDWGMPAWQLVNRLRGFSPWPGLHATLRDGRVKLHGLEEETPPPPGDEAPGTILTTGGRGILVRCGRGTALWVTELQRDGKRRMPADAFLIGERLSRGERFT